jgi:5-methylcytosine-specific restriction endonuclease McrA
MMRTLVLDMGYRPVNAVPFTKALRYIAKGKVDVLENYDRAVHPDWKMPAVVRLTGWMCTHTQKVRFSRQNVLVRDRWRCQYCGERKITAELTFDHVLPRSRGGRTEWENIVMACRECNASKGSRTPQEAGMPLKKRPVRPSWLPSFNVSLQQVTSVPSEWRDYWTVELLP